MATSNKTDLHTYDMNPETFSLIWLDEQVNTTEENCQAVEKLRASISYLKTFDKKKRCEKYILSASPQDRIVLIVNGRWGQELVPDIHHLRQISSIYVYCMDKKRHEQWAKNYTKVKNVCTKLDDLIIQIKSDHKSRVKREEPLTINIFKVSKNMDQIVTGLNGQFVHSLLLIDVLLRLKSTDKDKQELITRCKNKYQSDKTQLDILLEFEKKYSSNIAVWWYTRECFIYKMLNKALRTQDIGVIFLFRFFIRDIYEQLKQRQCKSQVRLYRGQVMSTDEITNLQQSIGGLISIKSFFSTSTSLQEASTFLKNTNSSHNLHQVLFVIDADPRVVTTKPFGDISQCSHHTCELEILFMIGCIFRLIDVYLDDDDSIWIVKMKLCGDNEHDLKNLFEHMKEDYGGGACEISPRTFGDVLRKMGELELSAKMYSRALKELAPDDPSLCKLYWSLGIVNNEKGDYDSSLAYFHKALKLEKQKNPFEYMDIGDLYNWIGECHRLKLDYDRALEWYNKAIEAFNQIQAQKHPNMAHFYNNIAIVYDAQKKYPEALEFNKKALTIRTNSLPSYHPDLARSHHSIGNVHYNLHQYDLALDHYKQSLQIQLKSLPSHHPDTARIYTNIGTVHEKKSELKQALTYYRKAATIYRHSLPAQHPARVFNENSIQRLSSQLK